MFKTVCQFWNRKCVFHYACFQVTLFNDFGICFWMLGFQNQLFGVKGVAKKQLFTSVAFGAVFTCFLMALRPILMTLRDRLEIS